MIQLFYSQILTLITQFIHFFSFFLTFFASTISKKKKPLLMVYDSNNKIMDINQ